MVERNNPVGKLCTECNHITAGIPGTTSKLVPERKFNQRTTLVLAAISIKIMWGLIVALKKVIKNIQEKLRQTDPKLTQHGRLFRQNLCHQKYTN